VSTDVPNRAKSAAEAFHPVDPVSSREPHAALAELRASCPVAHLGGPESGLPELHLMTRHDVVADVLRNYRTFGSIGFFPSIERFRAIPEELRSLIELDPPAHTRARRLNLIAMKPAAIAEVIPHVTGVARALTAEFRAAGRADLVSQFAVPLPADAIAAVLGLPTTDADLIHDWVESTFSEPPEHEQDRVPSGSLHRWSFARGHSQPPTPADRARQLGEPRPRSSHNPTKQRSIRRAGLSNRGAASRPAP
jgi:cytochrome P450